LSIDDGGWLEEEQPQQYCPFTHAIRILVQMCPNYKPAPYDSNDNTINIFSPQDTNYSDDEGDLEADNDAITCVFAQEDASSEEDQPNTSDEDENSHDDSLAYSEASSIDFDNTWIDDLSAPSGRLWSDRPQTIPADISIPLEVDADTTLATALTTSMHIINTTKFELVDVASGQYLQPASMHIILGWRLFALVNTCCPTRTRKSIIPKRERQSNGIKSN